jgi:uncharacterized protein with HEPN domain
MRQDEARLLDMLLACRDAREFVAGVSRQQFLADRKLQSAVCLKLEIVGEAARAVTAEFRRGHPGIPWADIVGLRHRIVHEYFRLDLDIIWEIVQRDVPALVRLIEPLAPPPEEQAQP